MEEARTGQSVMSDDLVVDAWAREVRRWLAEKPARRRFFPDGTMLPIAGGDDPPKPGDGQGGGGAGDGKGGDGDGKGGDGQTVPRAEVDKLRKELERRDTTLRQAQGNVRDLRKEMTGVLEALGIEGLSDDPEERQKQLDAVKEERARAKAGKSVPQTEVERLLADRDKKWQKQVDTEKAVADRRFNALRAEKVSKEAASAAIAQNATEGGAEAIRRFIVDEAQVVEEDDGTIRVHILGADGKPRYNGKGELMSVADRVAEYANDAKYAAFFRATGRPGGGTPPGHPPSPTTRKQLTAADLEAMTQREYEANKIGEKIRTGEIQLLR